MTRVVFVSLLAAASAFSQYKAQPAADGPPSDVAPAILATVDKAGTAIVTDKGATYGEIWLRSAAPSGPNSTETSITLPTIPAGALLGVVKFSGRASDRRGQTITNGTYTMRYGNYPINGDHQGVAPQRDFLVLAPAANDKSADAVPEFTALMDLSRKASGTPHPLVLSFWKSDSDVKLGFEKQGEADWVLNTKIGNVPVSIIVIGKAGE